MITYPTANTDLRRVTGALQFLQAVLALETATGRKEPTLADVCCWLKDLQRDFGAEAELEAVIQSCVGQDLATQLAQRHASAVQADPRAGMSHELCMVS